MEARLGTHGEFAEREIIFLRCTVEAMGERKNVVSVIPHPLCSRWFALPGNYVHLYPPLSNYL